MEYQFTPKINLFEVVLLIVGVTTAILGFILINRIYSKEGEMTWLMVVAIFNWLTLIVLFISLSVAADVSKKQLAMAERMVYLLERKKGNK
jgi:high-affinity K+ transport system ATPase subunit B